MIGRSGGRSGGRWGRFARLRRSAGQAQVELIAGIPIVLVAGLLALQALAVGYTLSLADGAAEAGALSLSGGGEPLAAAESAVPGWAKQRIGVSVEGSRVRVELRPPTLLPFLGDHLGVSSSAWARRPG